MGEVKMRISDIFESIKSTSKSTEKAVIMKANKDNKLLMKALSYATNPFQPFNVTKVPKVKHRLEFPLGEKEAWEECFRVLDLCAARKITGNNAVDSLHAAFSSFKQQDETWMRKVLKKHLNIGVSIKSVNKVFPNLVPTFEVSLAQKFDLKRIANKKVVAVEPKLDGIRCFAIVRGEQVLMFARSGKLIKNFDNTIALEVAKMGDGCYDGELMGQDFISLMRQAYRKEDIDTTGTYLALFDFLPLDEWDSKNAKTSCADRFEMLLDRLSDEAVNLELVQPVERLEVDSSWEDIKKEHDLFVEAGFEGAMIKFLDTPYKFGRGYEVMKLKAFHDADLAVVGLLEGTGKHTGKLGSFQVVFNGVNVQVGSGLTDVLREQIWEDKELFIGRIIEVRYQEVTPDGSLRFPTFVCFRNDRE